MRGTIGRGAVQDWRRRMEARLLRKLQPIRAQLKAVAGPSGFLHGVPDSYST